MVHIDNVENFDHGIGGSNAAHMGMAIAGTEEKVLKQLATAGSLKLEDHPDFEATGQTLGLGK